MMKNEIADNKVILMEIGFGHFWTKSKTFLLFVIYRVADLMAVLTSSFLVFFKSQVKETDNNKENKQNPNCINLIPSYTRNIDSHTIMEKFSPPLSERLKLYKLAFPLYPKMINSFSRFELASTFIERKYEGFQAQDCCRPSRQR